MYVGYAGTRVLVAFMLVAGWAESVAGEVWKTVIEVFILNVISHRHISSFILSSSATRPFSPPATLQDIRWFNNPCQHPILIVRKRITHFIIIAIKNTPCSNESSFERSILKSLGAIKGLERTKRRILEVSRGPGKTKLYSYMIYIVSRCFPGTTSNWYYIKSIFYLQHR